MKRDMDLVRAILRQVESYEDPSGMHEILEIEGYDQKEISYHINILNDAGLLEAMDISSTGPDGFLWWPGNLTWAGQEFISVAKDDSIWEKAKEKFMSPAMSFTFDIFFEYLKAKTMEKLNL